MVQKMIRHIPLAEDAEEELSINNINNVVLVGTLHQLWDIVFFNKLISIDDGWGCKVRGRKGQGTGRMRHMKDVGRK